MKKWVVPSVCPAIFCLNRYLIVPTEEVPVFKDGVEKKLKSLVETSFVLVSPAMWKENAFAY